MSSITEGATTLLDNSLVYATSCTSWGKIHAANEWPVLLAGKAGGALSGNLHVRAPDQNLSKVLFSIATVMGLNLTSLGQNEGLVNSGLTGLSPWAPRGGDLAHRAPKGSIPGRRARPVRCSAGARVGSCSRHHRTD